MDQFIPTLFDSIAQSAAAGGAKIVVALLILLIGFRVVKIFCKKLDKVSDKISFRRRSVPSSTAVSNSYCMPSF